MVNSTAIKSSLNGGAANDMLIGGSSHDTLTGGTGADVIKGMNGNDRALRPRPDLRYDDRLRRRGRPGTADKADLDVLPKDPTRVTGCETQTRH